MMIAGSVIDVLVYLLFLEIKEGTRIIGVTTNEVLKRLGSYLRYHGDAASVFKEIAYFKCIHSVPVSIAPRGIEPLLLA